MKHISFFFITFFTLYGLINIYIYRRGLSAVPAGSPLRYWYTAAFLFVALVYFAGRMLENRWISPVSSIFIWVGAFWFAAMTYFFLLALLFDFAAAINFFTHFYPKSITDNYPAARMWAAAGSVVLVVLAIAAGFLNANIPRVKTLDLEINKCVRGVQELRVAVASDIHLDTVFGGTALARVVKKINALDPDLVILVGDVVDEDIATAAKLNFGDPLRDIKSRLGVYSVTGNHEYIGGVEKTCKYLAEHGVRVLRDELMKISGVWIVGREDRSAGWHHGGAPRKPLADLMKVVDKRLPLIVLDHQPVALEEAREAGADLLLCGHTHGGQIWPINYITGMIYEVSYGYKKKGDMHVYVSCGAGVWGPMVRIGNAPEVIDLRLHFTR